MPMEHRRVVFSRAELRAALDTLRGRLRRAALPEGDIVSLLPVHKRGQYFVAFNVRDHANDRNRMVEIAEDDVQEALVEHCVRIRTPLPRKSMKSLRVIDDTVCIDISIGELGEAYGTRGVLREILAKQVEMSDALGRLSARLEGRTAGHGSAADTVGA